MKRRQPINAASFFCRMKEGREKEVQKSGSPVNTMRGELKEGREKEGRKSRSPEVQSLQ